MMNKKKYTKTDFEHTLKTYKQLIDADIKSYCLEVVEQTQKEFGEFPAEAVGAYCSLLNRGGKRIRGALTITSYKMFGGTNMQMAMQAARAIEMLHAYILIIDDIQDRSAVRRGGPTVHMHLKNYHSENNLNGDALHFGYSTALNGALFGVHSALNVLANLPVSETTRLNIIKNVNLHFITTAHGQTLDIWNEVVTSTDLAAVDKVLQWKTAFYTFMNPLQLGALLAGADSDAMSVLAAYSLHAGRAFQITDDILGVFGTEDASGKSPMDDIREGKRTVLTVRALENASAEDALFLARMLGNAKLTKTELMRCQQIIKQSGALEQAEVDARKSVDEALIVLKENSQGWGQEQISFLEELVRFLVHRNS